MDLRYMSNSLLEPLLTTSSSRMEAWSLTTRWWHCWLPFLWTASTKSIHVKSTRSVESCPRTFLGKKQVFAFLLLNFFWNVSSLGFWVSTPVYVSPHIWGFWYTIISEFRTTEQLLESRWSIEILVLDPFLKISHSTSISSVTSLLTISTRHIGVVEWRGFKTSQR